MLELNRTDWETKAPLGLNLLRGKPRNKLINKMNLEEVRKKRLQAPQRSSQIKLQTWEAPTNSAFWLMFTFSLRASGGWPYPNKSKPRPKMTWALVQEEGKGHLACKRRTTQDHSYARNISALLILNMEG